MAIHTNIKDFHWCFGTTVMPRISKEAFDESMIKLKVMEGEVDLSEDLDSLPTYGHFRWEEHGKALYYDRKLLPGLRLKVKIIDAHTNHPKVYVNRAYRKLVTHRFMNLHSIGYMMTDLACFLLLKNGFAPLYASAFSHNNKATIVFGPPNTGKTLTSMRACSEYGAEFISEDMVVTDGKNLYAVPWTSSYRKYDQRRTLLPMSELTSGKRPNHMNDVATCQRSIINKIVILQKHGTPSCKPSTTSEITSKMLNLNRYGFQFRQAPVLAALTYFHSEFTIREAEVREHRLIQRLAQHAHHRLVVSDLQATNYISTIQGAFADEQQNHIS
ncbi:hypothetical protein [Thalassobacillus hwangdonensis]|uniref:Uncharacterized protein n=1 Tax=Thalassobacillus hwangdonensis TaxID=546108 RepID=A0ABW3L2E9_9BACI